jgi:Zn-dependent protease with chaperone function
MDFFDSGLGQYIIQTIFHSLIIAIVVESMISIWHIRRTYAQIKFRLLALLLPILYLPLYYLVYPPRTRPYFHEQVALIDLNEWLGLKLVGGLAVWHLFAALLALTTYYFVIKEAIPSIRYYFWHRPSFPLLKEGQFPKLDAVLAKLSKNIGRPMPAVFVSAKDAPMIYSLGRNALVLSESTINMLDSEELEAVIAHELAHLAWQASGINRLFLALRFLMFYNPVALFIFRRNVNDTEKICDDIAVSFTGKHLAIASGLLKVSRNTAAASSPVTTGVRRRWLSPRISALENQAYRRLVKERVERMIHPDKSSDVPYQNFRVVFIAWLLVALLFFVV